jgi:hypothetical protein
MHQPALFLPVQNYGGKNWNVLIAPYLVMTKALKSYEESISELSQNC